MILARQSTTTKLIFALVLFAAACLLSVVFAKPAAAYSGGRLIDDAVFRDSSTMSAAEIQSFLESKNSGLKNFRPDKGIECYGPDSKERELYVAAGASCSEEYLASRIIYYAAKVYGVNPQVILATLQKEQSLITTTNPTTRQKSQAMGYGCPTTGSCESDSNFSYQIDSGTWVLRYHYERANKNNNWWNPSSGWTCGTKKNFYTPNLYPGQNVTFKDGNGTAYRTHFIKNAATSSFYCYTPHAYNNPNGLFGLPRYGTKGQYYTGSYNFVKSFENWFGSTIGGIQLVKSASSSTIYLIDRERKVPISSADSLEAWRFDERPVSTLGSEALSIYPTASSTLRQLAKNHRTNNLFFVDNGKAHHVHTSAIAAAWDLNGTTAPTIHGDTIDTLEKLQSLSYFAKPSGSGTIYFVENGNKLPIRNMSSLELIQGVDKTPKTRGFSTDTMSSLTTATSIGHGFRVGSQWYVFDYGVIRKVNSAYAANWDLTGAPTLSSNSLQFFRVAKTLNQSFRNKTRWYTVNDDGGFKSTVLKSTAKRWGALDAPIINRRLMEKVVD